MPPPEHLFPPDEWRIVEARWTPEFSDRAETAFALSNGFIGVRGTLDEGRPALDPATFVNGFHETWPIVHAEEAYGLARTGQTICTVPDAMVLELFVDDEPLYVPTARLREYARVLDMRDGVLRRDLVWSTAAGKHVTVHSCRLVSLEHRHLVAVEYEVSVDHAAQWLSSRARSTAWTFLDRDDVSARTPASDVNSSTACSTASSPTTATGAPCWRTRRRTAG